MSYISYLQGSKVFTAMNTQECQNVFYQLAHDTLTGKQHRPT